MVHPHGEVIGQSAAIQKVLRQVEQVAPTDSSVLVRGETGTGKELVAQAIHRLSPRRGHLMVKVNCAALPSGLVESELFGREKGAYTGAMTRQIGRFEVADGSTLFLDEIGELSLEVQAKLLRVLETGEFERLGSPRTIKVDVRLIAATNRDLVEEVRKGRFREDLYYRLNVFPIRVPPLRERAEDIPLLVWTFLEEFSARMGKKITQVPRQTMEALQRHPWPGNVRELRNVIEHGAILTTGDTLQVPMLDDAAPVGGAAADAGRRRARAHPPGARESGLAYQGAEGRGRGAGAQPLDPLQPHEEAGHPAAGGGLLVAARQLAHRRHDAPPLLPSSGRSRAPARRVSAVARAGPWAWCRSRSGSGSRSRGSSPRRGGPSPSPARGGAGRRRGPPGRAGW